MRITHVLLDMDEVLCDFVGGAVKAHGTTKEDLLANCKPNEWSIVEPLGLTIDTFWEPIHAQGSTFWERLEPMPWFWALIECVEYFVGTDWHIVSAPSRCDTSYTGKVRWLKTMLGKDFNRFILTPHKYLFAKSSYLLIDDRPKNVIDFVCAGGNSILFPSPFNENAYCSHDPVHYVRQKLSSFSHLKP